jgi:single-stranded-DNA-specific exonuclease
VEAFKEFLYDHVRKQMRGEGADITTQVDGVLSVRGANVKLVNMLQRQIGPFGQEASEPQFLFQNIRIHNADVVGEAHVRVMISDWEGGGRMKAMAFRAVGTPLGEALLKRGTAAFNILGILKIDTWGGNEKVEMHIRDADFFGG